MELHVLGFQHQAHFKPPEAPHHQHRHECDDLHGVGKPPPNYFCGISLWVPWTTSMKMSELRQSALHQTPLMSPTSSEMALLLQDECRKNADRQTVGGYEEELSSLCLGTVKCQPNKHRGHWLSRLSHSGWLHRRSNVHTALMDRGLHGEQQWHGRKKPSQPHLTRRPLSQTRRWFCNTQESSLGLSLCVCVCVSLGGFLECAGTCSWWARISFIHQISSKSPSPGATHTHRWLPPACKSPRALCRNVRVAQWPHCAVIWLVWAALCGRVTPVPPMPKGWQSQRYINQHLEHTDAHTETWDACMYMQRCAHTHTRTLCWCGTVSVCSRVAPRAWLYQMSWDMKGCFDRFLNTSFALTCWWFERAHREAQQDNLLLFAKIWQHFILSSQEVPGD